MQFPEIVPEGDRQIYQAAGYGGTRRFGSASALLVVDVTYAFTGDRPEPVLESIRRFPRSSGEAAWSAIGVLEELLPLARSAGVPIIYTKNAPRRSSVEAGGWGEKLRDRPGDGDVDPNEIVDEIAPTDSDLVLEKTKPSAFFGTPLAAWLIQLGIDTVLIAGGSTSGCVRATATDAFSYNLATFIVEEGTFDRTRTSHELNLFEIHQKYADVVGVEDVKRYFRSLA